MIKTVALPPVGLGCRNSRELLFYAGQPIQQPNSSRAALLTPMSAFRRDDQA